MAATPPTVLNLVLALPHSTGTALYRSLQSLARQHYPCLEVVILHFPGGAELPVELRIQLQEDFPQFQFREEAAQMADSLEAVLNHWDSSQAELLLVQRAGAWLFPHVLQYVAECFSAEGQAALEVKLKWVNSIPLYQTPAGAAQHAQAETLPRSSRLYDLQPGRFERWRPAPETVVLHRSLWLAVREQVRQAPQQAGWRRLWGPLLLKHPLHTFCTLHLAVLPSSVPLPPPKQLWGADPLYASDNPQLVEELRRRLWGRLPANSRRWARLFLLGDPLWGRAFRHEFPFFRWLHRLMFQYPPLLLTDAQQNRTRVTPIDLTR